jgi:hypothetical protein
MKLNVIFLPVLALMLALSACSSNPKVKEEQFVVDIRSPKVAIGTIEVQFDKMLALAGLKKDTVNVEYYPREDAVCLQYRYEFYNYNQFWSRDAREAFVKALGEYKTDYEEKNFGKSNRKAKRHYGIAEGYLIWQMFQYTIQAKGSLNIEMGYYFKNKSPYFVTNQMEAEYKDLVARDNDRVSPQIMMYFTRAQADELVALFDQQFLQGIAPKSAILDASADYEEY